MKKIWLAASALYALFALPASAQTISSYDISGARPSGFGGWSHNYSGVISGSDYIGGSGTLNDGFVPNTEQNNQLFDITRSPTITAYLDGLYTLSTIDILSATTNNGIPGNITGFNLTVAGITQFYQTQGFGNVGNSGFPVSERVTLTGPASAIGVNSFTLSGFTTAGSFPEFFAVGELSANGMAAAPVSAAVPEPGTWAMMLLGFGFVGGMMRSAKRRQKFTLSYT